MESNKAVYIQGIPISPVDGHVMSGSAKLEDMLPFRIEGHPFAGATSVDWDNPKPVNISERITPQEREAHQMRIESIIEAQVKSKRSLMRRIM